MSSYDRIFATAATADKPDAAVGVVWFGAAAADGYALAVLDYRLSETSDVKAEWMREVFWRSIELDNEHKPARTGCLLRVEHFGLRSVLERADEAFRASDDARTVERTAFDLKPVSDTERAKWPATLDERMSSLRPLINSGRVVRYGRGLGRYNWRARRINHLSEQLRQHRPGDATSAGELLQAFVLGVLLGTTRSSSFFDVMARMEEADERKARGEPHPALSGPFAYIQGRRPR